MDGSMTHPPTANSGTQVLTTRPLITELPAVSSGTENDTERVDSRNYSVR